MPSAEPATRRLAERARDRADVLVLVAAFAAIQFFPGGMPAGTYGLALVDGASLALYAMGLVLVYRSNRIINFAQVQIGFLTATFFAVMVQYRPLFQLLDTVCPPCLDQPSPGMVAANYWLSVGLAMALSVLVAYAIAVLVVQRFARAPRLLLTVATIFLAQLLAGVQGLLPTLLTTAEQRLDPLRLGASSPPLDWVLGWEPARFNTSQILTVAVAALALVALVSYFRLTRTGVALRAAAADPDRAATLGVNVRATNRRAWMLSGGLSGAAGVLAAMGSAAPVEATLAVSQMVTLLAAAVVAAMASLPIAAAAAVTFQVLVFALDWSFNAGALTDVVLLGFIVVVLVLQRRSSWAGRAESTGLGAAPEARPVPAELWALPVVRRPLLALAGLAGVALLGYPWVMTLSQSSTATRMMIFAIVGLSLLVLTGWAGHISLGQFGLAAVGGYVAAASQLPFLAAILVGGVAGGLVAAAVGLPALRLRGPQLAITSLAFAVAAPTILVLTVGRWVPDSLERPALAGLDFAQPRAFYYLVLVVLAAVVAAVVGLRRTRTGRVLIAARDNEHAAQAFGVNLLRARLGAFATSGFVAALAGALFAYQLGGVTADTYLAEQSVSLFVMAVLGGLGSVLGPLLGAVYFGALELLGANPVVSFLAAGGGGLAVVLLLPGGLGQLAFGLRDSWLRTVARRRGLAVAGLQGAEAAEGDRPRAPLAPKRHAGGVAVSASPRYRLDEQAADGDRTDDTREPTGG